MPAGNREANIQLIGHISNMCVLYYEVKKGSFTTQGGENIICNALNVASEKYVCPLVTDNAPYHSRLDNENRGQLPQGEYRLQRLEIIINSNMQLITAAKCGAFIVHVQHFIECAIANEDVYF